MWSTARFVFLSKTGSRYPTLEVCCGFRFWQFSDCGHHFFSALGENSRMLKINVEFVVGS